MNNIIKIRELIKTDGSMLIKNNKFNTLKPVNCNSCGNTNNFSRRIFRITGVPKSEQDADEIHNILHFHFKERYGIDHIFFKTYRNGFYVDSAICEECNSTMIAFDIDITDDMIKKMSKIAGIPVNKIKKDLNQIMSKLSSKKFDK
jgi:hypothetical protein